MNPPRMAVFDLGGVVVRICRSWQEGCAAAGVKHQPVVNGRTKSPQLKELLRAHQCGQIESAEYFSGLANAFGEHSIDEISAVHTAWILGDYPGIAEVIEQIHSAGIETACLSNTNAHHWKQLAGSHALQLIGQHHASHLMQMVKPDAEIYRAFEVASGVRPQQLVFFDDLLENIEGARQCGWNAVHIDHEGDTAQQVLAGLRAHGALL